jgi:FAD/FMN-containing dehydrogenase
MRSTGERVLCSSERNAELFRATIGGLGLTGLILWAEIRLKPVPGAAIAMEQVRFTCLEEFLDLSSSDQEYEYTVAWVDCLAQGRRLGRGLFMRGDHASGSATSSEAQGARLKVPIDLPSGFINRTTLAIFNTCYYRRQLRAKLRKTVNYEQFFFPLDRIGEWNRLYGRRGFFQYQCVVPDDLGRTIAALLAQVARSSETPALAVLKRFGSIQSPGLLSFPRPGITLAIDFANRGPATLAFLEQLDRLVVEAGGAVYPAKDARMSGASFRRFFPAWEAFASHVDPKFSSSFWRRVTAA